MMTTEGDDAHKGTLLKPTFGLIRMCPLFFETMSLSGHPKPANEGHLKTGQ